MPQRKPLLSSSFPLRERAVAIYNPFASDTRILLTLLGVLFLFFSLNPYASILALPTDQQPIVHVFSIPLFFLFLAARLDRISIILFSTALIALVFLCIEPSFTAARSSYNYVSFFVIFFVALGLFKYTKVNFEFILFLTFWLWFFVGLIQLFIPDFLTFLVNNPRTTAERGVTSLATEPTYYGVVMLFYVLFFRIIKPKYEMVYVFLATVAIFVFAKSAMAALFLILYFFVASFFGRYWSIRFFYIILLFFLPLFFHLLPDSRLKNLLSSLIKSPFDVVLLDASVNDRFFHIFLSLKGFFVDFGFPHGFTGFAAFAERQLSIYSDIIIVEWFSLSDRIMSGLGAALFELGFIGLVYLFIPMFVMYPLLKYGFGFFLSVIFLFYILYFSAVPIGFSLFPLFLAVVYYNTRYGNVSP